MRNKQWPPLINSVAASLEKIIGNAVEKGVSDRALRAEADAKMFREAGNKAKIRVSHLEQELVQLRREWEAKVKHAVMAACRESWLDVALGDAVYAIHTKYVRLKCPTCKGTKRVQVLMHGKSLYVNCPTCDFETTAGVANYSIVDGTVTEVSASITGNPENPDINISVWLMGGVGVKHSMRNMYRTREEAEARLAQLQG